jgi:hypothetical protein
MIGLNRFEIGCAARFVRKGENVSENRFAYNRKQIFKRNRHTLGFAFVRNKENVSENRLTWNRGLFIASFCHTKQYL